MSLRNCRFLLGMAGQILKYRLHHLLPLEHFTSRRLIWTVKLLQRLLPTRDNLPEQLTDALISRGAAAEFSRLQVTVKSVQLEELASRHACA